MEDPVTTQDDVFYHANFVRVFVMLTQKVALVRVKFSQKRTSTSIEVYLRVIARSPIWEIRVTAGCEVDVCTSLLVSGTRLKSSRHPDREGWSIREQYAQFDSGSRSVPGGCNARMTANLLDGAPKDFLAHAYVRELYPRNALHYVVQICSQMLLLGTVRINALPRFLPSLLQQF